MSCVDSITGSVSVVSEAKLEELWDKNVFTQILGGVLETLESLEPSALNKVFFIAARSTDLLPLSASSFPTLGDIPTISLSTNLTVLLRYRFSYFFPLEYDYAFWKGV